MATFGRTAPVWATVGSCCTTVVWQPWRSILHTAKHDILTAVTAAPAAFAECSPAASIQSSLCYLLFHVVVAMIANRCSSTLAKDLGCCHRVPAILTTAIMKTAVCSVCSVNTFWLLFSGVPAVVASSGLCTQARCCSWCDCGLKS